MNYQEWFEQQKEQGLMYGDMATSSPMRPFTIEQEGGDAGRLLGVPDGRLAAAPVETPQFTQPVDSYQSTLENPLDANGLMTPVGYGNIGAGDGQYQAQPAQEEGGYFSNLDDAQRAAYGAAIMNIGDIWTNQKPKQNIASVYLSAKKLAASDKATRAAALRQTQQDERAERKEQRDITSSAISDKYKTQQTKDLVREANANQNLKGYATEKFKDVEKAYTVHPPVKTYIGLDAVIGEVETLLDNKTKVSDAGAIKKVAKALDPSIVTDADFNQVAQGTGGIIARLYSTLQRLEDGTMSDQDRQALWETVQDLYASSHRGAQQYQERMGGRLGQYFNIEDVFSSTGIIGDYVPNTKRYTPLKTPTAGNPNQNNTTNNYTPTAKEQAILDKY
jgi:hypothetical protein